MDSVLFSIIIPIYNCAPFLREAVESVLRQTCRDYELILVNDGSNDDSLSIANKYAEARDNVQVISIPHAGPGAARNAGIEAAKGSYLLFLDADDYWQDTELLRQLKDKLIAAAPQVIMFRHVKTDVAGNPLQYSPTPDFPEQNDIYALRDVYANLVKDGQALASVWNKCVAKELVTKNNIRFLELTSCEDIDWVLQLFSHVETIAFLNTVGYAYRQYSAETRATADKAGPENLAKVIELWGNPVRLKNVSNSDAVSGFAAFEYAIYMGYSHRISKERRKKMKRYQFLLGYGLDRKTKLIALFHGMFGYHLTCLAVRAYLYLRKRRYGNG